MTSPVTRVPPAAVAPLGAGITHPGTLRRNNEDAILTDPSGALWAVADGMGGYGHGDLAADIVIEHLARLPYDAASPALLVAALEAANAEIRARAAAEGIGPMGATVVAALIDGATATVAWAGDSRAYRLGADGLARLTHDHSVVQELIDGGRLDAAAAEGHPQAHVVTRAVGADDRIEVAVVPVALAPGDRLMLCSDGLTKSVPEAEIAPLLAAGEPEAACRRLIEAALSRGAPDNVSVIVVRAGEADAR